MRFNPSRVIPSRVIVWQRYLQPMAVCKSGPIFWSQRGPHRLLSSLNCSDAPTTPIPRKLGDQGHQQGKQRTTWLSTGGGHGPLDLEDATLHRQIPHSWLNSIHRVRRQVTTEQFSCHNCGPQRWLTAWNRVSFGPFAHIVAILEFSLASRTFGKCQ